MNNITMTLQVDHLIMEALREDISSEDVTTNAGMKEAVTGEVQLICKQDGVVAGLDVFHRVFEILDENEEYAVVSKETYNGLVRYDRIVKNADKVSEQDILY